jgi:hypothetical protein
MAPVAEVTERPVGRPVALNVGSGYPVAGIEYEGDWPWFKFWVVGVLVKYGGPCILYALIMT